MSLIQKLDALIEKLSAARMDLVVAAGSLTNDESIFDPRGTEKDYPESFADMTPERKVELATDIATDIAELSVAISNKTVEGYAEAKAEAERLYPRG